jgi:hypothetical protein
MLPLAVIGAGVLLLIIAVIIVLRPSKKTSYAETISTTPVNSPPIKPELHAKPNPEPPPIPGFGVIKPQQSGGYRSVSDPRTIERPDVIEMPSEDKPVAAPMPQATQPAIPTPAVTIPSPAAPTPPPAPTPAPSVAPPQQISETPKPSQSMLQRLKEKGINIPDKKSEAPVPESGNAPSGDSQPPTTGWPEDSQK